MNQLLNDYGIFILVLLFIVFSLYYRNFVNIGVFIILFVGLRIIVGDEQALLYSYCIAIFYGIVKNFHLLENFTSSDGNNQEKRLVPAKGVSISGLFNAHKNNESVVRMALKNKLVIEPNAESSDNNNSNVGSVNDDTNDDYDKSN